MSYSKDFTDGGITTSVHELCSSQKIKGIRPYWITTQKSNNSFLKNNLKKKFKEFDPEILHIHGIWRSPTRAYKLYLKENLPFIISPHGMLDAWAMNQSKIKKQIYWSIIEKWSLNSCNCIHALCKSEYNSIKDLGLQNDVALIPNGVKIYKKKELNLLPNPPWNNIIPKNSKILLFFGRFHRKKGIKELLYSWKKVFHAAQINNWWLVLVGYGDDINPKFIIEKLQLNNCIVLDPVFDEKIKASTYINSNAFILPSFSEGLPMSVLEAMSFRKATLITKACNLNEAFLKKAAIEIKTEEEDIVNKLNDLFLQSQDQLDFIGENAFQFAKANYSWEKISSMSKQLYEWIAGYSEKPKFVLHT